MASKYFCIGLGKTGTKTFANVMKASGFQHLNGPVNQGLVWRSSGQTEKLWEIVDRYQSFDDYPYPLMYRELADRYPDAHFFLTHRSSAEQWADSLIEHHRRYGPSDPQILVFGSYPLQNEKQQLIDFYNDHNRAVKEFFNGTGQLEIINWTDPESVRNFLIKIGSPLNPHEIRSSNRKEDYSADRIILRFIKNRRPGAALNYINNIDSEELRNNLIKLFKKHYANPVRTRLKLLLNARARRRKF